ncbi:sensor histidine kinase [Fertoebacter nigrum]|uniref:histidine kinase n=1 Tax=Fertoeibacter niger TaxID=2656921 RepID=A0A8X8KMS6_9RHOB|nr:sensor histidine kinase [Fertoeibacter niger]NUB43275.1 sensor histidine kinase [Fertoeibacter niger]
MTRYSLRRRLLGWLLVSTAVLGMLALADTWREAIRTATSVSDRVLAGSALAIAERVSVDEDGGLEVDIPYSALEMLTSTAQDRVFYRVDGPPGAFLTGYEDLGIVPADGDGTVFADAMFGDEPIRVATLHRQATTGFDSIAFTVTVAETTLARRELARAILWRAGLRLAGMILGASVAVWVAVTLALRPLNRLGEAIAERSPDDLRPIRAATPSEVEGLVEAVNSFMTRLGTALAGLRNFTGNASHQLRTPMAVVRTELALATRAATLDESRRANARADAALAEAERVLAQLLLLARVDAAGRGMEPVNLTALARDLTAELVPDAAEAGLDLGFDGQGTVWLRAEPVLLRELLRNLIQNALLYAGHGAEVTVRVAGAGGAAVLAVEDDGPGIPPARRALIGQRFTPSGGEGMGLGLAIVAEIAALFGGVLDLADGAGGRGLRATVRFAEQA